MPEPCSASRVSPSAPRCLLIPRPAPELGTKTWEDNFDGSSLSTSRWRLWGEDKVVNSPQTLNRWDAASVSSGSLKITGTQTALTGSPRFRSALIITKDKFSQQYGYFEARLKFPPGQYMWPAFWMLPADSSWPPEIDVMEYNGSGWPNVVHHTYHYTNSSGQWTNSQGTSTSANSPWNGGWGTNFHTYAVLWEPGKITWYIDGVQKYQTSSNVTSKPMYLLLNLAIGGTWPGNVPDGHNIPTSVMEVDWVRVWSQNGTTTPPASGAPIGQTLGFKALNNGKFASNNLNSGNVIVASFANSVGGWESFTIVDAGGGKVALRSNANNRFVSVNNGVSHKPLVASFATNIGDWEKFTWEDRGGNKFALKSNITNRYVSCDLNNGGRLVAQWATSVGSWEEFQY